jgi:thioredoxin-dependent peroxiredoxin
MTLKVGDNAPSFSAKDQHGNTIKLADFQGKKVVLYFYPKDSTPTCTTQACNLRDNYASMQAQGYTVLGVSADDEKSHLKFAQKHNLPFSLLADTDLSIIQTYGVWGEKQLYGKKYMGIIRTTFVINEQGIIEDIISKIDAKSHTAQIIKS